jgi:glycosyltransferase involved in cell wall biosynthesis
MNPDLRVALVHDALPYYSGAERVLAAILELFPHAPVHTLVFDRNAFAGTIFQNHTIYTSWINRLPGSSRHFKILAPLLPLTVENIDLREYDIIISNSYAFAHGVSVSPNQLHISYKSTPLRFAWNGYHDLIRHRGILGRIAISPLVQYLRKWDLSAARRVDHFVVNSKWIGQWVKHIYHCNASVVYPPVEIERFFPLLEREDYYLLVCRLVRHKRADLVIEAFNRLGLPLVVVGDGPLRGTLQRRAAPNIRFLGWKSNGSVEMLLNRAKAFVYAGLEDFGIVIAEAQAAGCPVIAYARGGASEIVLDGQTGILYKEQSVEALVQAVGDFEDDPQRFVPTACRDNAQRFSKRRFKEEFSSQVELQLSAFSGRSTE